MIENEALKNAIDILLKMFDSKQEEAENKETESREATQEEIDSVWNLLNR